MSGSWRLELEVEAACAEALAEGLEGRGARAVSLSEAAGGPIYEPPPGSAPLWRRTRLSALFDDPQAARAALGWLSGQGLGQPALAEVAERDWLAEGRRAARVRLAGERLAVVPEGHAAPPGRVAVDLDPGLAFGTGSHPSTALCLAWLDAEIGGGERVCDWGCGCGILAIAALRLGAAAAVAVDIDPQAVRATRLNAARNGVLTRVSVAEPWLAPRAPCDLVIANILAGPLAALAPELVARLRPGARLGLAGLLAGQAEGLVRAYAAHVGLAVHAELDGWVLLAGARLG